MQQRSDRFVLSAPAFQDDRRHCQEVREVGDGRALANLAGVQLVGEGESLVEAR